MVVVVVVPLLQKGALLRGDRGPAALRRRVDLRGKGAAEALHRARVRREALEEAGVNRGGDAGVEVVRLGGGDRVYCVSGVGDGRRRGARLHGPRRSESGQGGRNRAAAGALHLRERGRREHVIAAGAVVDVVRAGGLHLGLHLGRWRIGVQARGGGGRGGGGGVRLLLLLLRRRQLSLLMYVPVALKVTGCLCVTYSGEAAQVAVGGAALLAVGLRSCQPRRLILHVALM